MNRKRIPALILALTLAVSPAAFAVEALPTSGLLISPNPNAGYTAAITINGETLESFEGTVTDPETGAENTVTVYLSDLPAVPSGYVPLRAVTQADGGRVYWYEEENYSWFKLWDFTICTYFDDMTVTVDDVKLEGVEPLLVGDFTYLPVSVINDLAGFTVTGTTDGGRESYEISTPNGTPMMKLANQLLEVSDMGFGMRNSPERMEQYYGEVMGFRAEFVTEGVFYTGVNIRPDTLMMGRVAEGHLEDLSAAMEAYRQMQEDTFSWYLSQNLPKVQNAKFVTEGDWFLFVISENAEETVETFRTAVRAMESGANYMVPVVKEN